MVPKTLTTDTIGADVRHVRDAETGRLNLRTSDIALAKEKSKEASDTAYTRLKDTCCYLVYPYQETATADVEFASAKVAAQDGVLSRASKKLVSDEALLPEIGPERLNRELEKNIWHENDHLKLKDLWEYSNRYIYLPRLKGRETLTKAVQAAIGAIVPGPFAYAEGWDDSSGSYVGLSIEGASSTVVSIDQYSILVRPKVAEANRPQPQPSDPDVVEPKPGTPTYDPGKPRPLGPVETPNSPKNDPNPTRFVGTVMLSAERPARDMHQVVEAIVQQLTTLQGAEVSLKLEIEAEVESGLDRS